MADNLVRLMSESKHLRTIKQMHAACPEVSTGTIDRIRREEVATSVDVLAALASAFELEPWQMLVPGIKAGDKTMPTHDAVQAARELLRYAAHLAPASPTNVIPLPASTAEAGGLLKTAEQKQRRAPHPGRRSTDKGA